MPVVLFRLVAPFFDSSSSQVPSEAPSTIARTWTAASSSEKLDIVTEAELVGPELGVGVPLGLLSTVGSVSAAGDV